MATSKINKLWEIFKIHSKVIKVYYSKVNYLREPSHQDAEATDENLDGARQSPAEVGDHDTGRSRFSSDGQDCERQGKILNLKHFIDLVQSF